jgi:phosphoadenosine phosphosulfate reductase
MFLARRTPRVVRASLSPAAPASSRHPPPSFHSPAWPGASPGSASAAHTYLLSGQRALSSSSAADHKSALAEYTAQVEPLFKGDPLQSPLSVIAWAAKTFEGRVAMSTSMGLQAAVLLHMATRVMPNLPVVWVDTGFLPKETYSYAEELRQVLGLNLIVSANPAWSAARIEAIHGKLWEKEDAESHTLYGKLTKVDPLALGLAQLEPSPVALLAGVRASQTKARAEMSPVGFSGGRFQVRPMLRMSDADVATYMDKFDLPKHPLQAKGYATVGDWHSSRPVKAGEDARATRFGGKFEECGLHVDTHEPANPSEGGGDASPASSSSSSSAVKGEPIPLPEGLEALGFVKSKNETELAVIMVKKKNEDGSFCRKCVDVADKMKQDDVDKWIGHVAIADVTNANSEGVKLAARFQVATAPFFLVRTRGEENNAENWKPVRSYLQVRKMLTDAAQAVAQKNVGVPAKEDPKLAEAKLHAEELKAQIGMLKARLLDEEKRIVGMESASQ